LFVLFFCRRYAALLYFVSGHYHTSAARLLNYILTCFYLADISMSCQRLSAAGKMERPSAYVLLFANLALRGFGTVVGLYLALLALLCNL